MVNTQTNQSLTKSKGKVAAKGEEGRKETEGKSPKTTLRPSIQSDREKKQKLEHDVLVEQGVETILTRQKKRRKKVPIKDDVNAKYSKGMPPPLADEERRTIPTTVPQLPPPKGLKKQRIVSASEESIISEVISEVTFDSPTTNGKIPAPSDKHQQHDKKPNTPHLKMPEDGLMNKPHQSLDYPPLYYIFKRVGLLHIVEALYSARWSMSYPLQRRVFFSRYLQTYNIYFTWGELLILLPLIFSTVWGLMSSFLNPSVTDSGHASRNAVIFAFLTACHNSLLTMLIGLPFERALWYHKLAGRIGFVGGIFHTYVAFCYPVPSQETYEVPVSSNKGAYPNVFQFLFYDTINSGGSFLLIAMSVIIISSLPWIRRRLFELFYILHIVFAFACLICAFYHTGVLIPILGSLTWGVDLVFRRIYMAFIRHPTKAGIAVSTNNVVELSFEKSGSFDYNPGQYCFICVPEISMFEWHPFSISSSPHQDTVSFHIRAAGNWTRKLYALAEEKVEVKILFEGPYGSVGVDLMNPQRYKTILLISGGIGCTPMQSICNQLMYEHEWGKREIKKLQFVWMERDPRMMDHMETVRRHSSVLKTTQKRSFSSIVTGMRSKASGDISLASMLLGMAGRDEHVTDEELEDQYDLERQEEENAVSQSKSAPKKSQKINEFPHDIEKGFSTTKEGNEFTTIDIPSRFLAKNTVLDMRIHLTSKNISEDYLRFGFVHQGRPDLKQIFMDLRIEALAHGEKRVAVCICAPTTLVHLCHKLAICHSDEKVRFDFHEEVFS